jgi:hypothetical protein
MVRRCRVCLEHPLRCRTVRSVRRLAQVGCGHGYAAQLLDTKVDEIAERLPPGVVHEVVRDPTASRLQELVFAAGGRVLLRAIDTRQPCKSIRRKLLGQCQDPPSECSMSP